MWNTNVLITVGNLAYLDTILHLCTYMYVQTEPELMSSQPHPSEEMLLLF